MAILKERNAVTGDILVIAGTKNTLKARAGEFAELSINYLEKSLEIYERGNVKGGEEKKCTILTQLKNLYVYTAKPEKKTIVEEKSVKLHC